jgi:pilus assembly protein FimV
MALGLGELSLNSFLNEPLDARVDLLNVGSLHEDQIKIRLATSDDFKKMGIDRAYFLTGITFSVDLDDNGRARILLSSEDPVLEPYLDFIIEARWPSGRLLREYTVLVDPPVFDESATVISASQRIADGEAEVAKKKQIASSASGTRVDVSKKSTLAPGEMPQRGYNSGTSERPVAGSRYMIHRDDTLWEIAANARPAGASVHQTMLDIQRMNPKAFIEGNINRIKSGYIIYLPAEGDISSANNAAALAEVRAQNQAWEEAKAAGTVYGSGPSLRISAGPEETATTADASPQQREVGATAAAMEDMDKAELERSEMAARLQAMEQQVETLQRIVNLKDDQIAALQNALTGDEDAIELEQATMDEAAVDAGLAAQIEALEGEVPVGGEELIGEDAGDTGTAEEEVVETAPEAEVVEVASEPAVAVVEPAPAPAETPAAPQSGGIMSYIWYVLGAVVLAVLGFVFMRRRGDGVDDEAPGLATTSTEDVFADVELQEQVLEVEEADEPAIDIEEEEEVPATPPPANRGYGQRKNDEYASDVEASDALAEADIYIAYGRYPQAIDLLQNALVTDPDNAEFRLKLLEVHVLMRDRASAMKQMSQLESVGDAGVIARAGALVAELDNKSAGGAAGRAAGELDAADPDMMAEIEESLEADFSGLEIEPDGDDDDLDLSADFEATDLSTEDLDEDLVIAAESSGMSTKLDLARAYLDMGDEGGARQILEEVAAEGDEELQAEARALLDRIG